MLLTWRNENDVKLKMLSAFAFSIKPTQKKKKLLYQNDS